MLQSRLRALVAERAMREQRTISFREITRATGVSASTLTGIANTTIREYPKEALEKLCAYFGVGIADLLIFVADNVRPAPSNEQCALGRRRRWVVAARSTQGTYSPACLVGFP